MMRGAKASAITESLYQRWTEILSKLSDEFAEKIERPKPLLKSPRSFGQKRRYRSLWHFCSKQYREWAVLLRRRRPATRSQAKRLSSWG